MKTKAEPTWESVFPLDSAMEPISCSSGSAPGKICLNRAPLGPLGSLSLLYLPARYSKGMRAGSGLSSPGSVWCSC